MKNSHESSNWKIEYPHDIDKVFKKFTKKEQKRILDKIDELKPLKNPLLHAQVTPLVGLLKGKWKLKWGKFRVVFALDAKRKVIQILLVARRSEKTYKKLE